MTSSPLDDFLANAPAYNAASVAKTIRAIANREAHLTGGPVSITIDGVDESKSLKSLLVWCAEHPQSADKLGRAIDLMVSGWERAKFMELLDQQSLPPEGQTAIGRTRLMENLVSRAIRKGYSVVIADSKGDLEGEWKK